MNFFVSPTKTCKQNAPARQRRRKLLAAMQTAEAYRLIDSCSDVNWKNLFDAAGALRDRVKGRTVTYSRKIFLPVTNLCRDRCGYCTFRKDPGRSRRLDHVAAGNR